MNGRMPVLLLARPRGLLGLLKMLADPRVGWRDLQGAPEMFLRFNRVAGLQCDQAETGKGGGGARGGAGGGHGVGWTAVVPVAGRSTTQPTTISASTATTTPTTISGPDGDDCCGGGGKLVVPYGVGGW